MSVTPIRCRGVAALARAIDHRPLRVGLASILAALTISGWDGPVRGATTFGVGGVYRLGCWTEISSAFGTEVASIETRDGDGMQVEYSWSGDPIGNYAIAGSEAAPLVLLDQAGSRLESRRFPARGSPSRGPAMIDPDTPWVFVIGEPLGIETIGANELLNLDSRIAVSSPSAAVELPSSVLGYDGVDLMVMTGAGVPLLNESSDLQRRAIADWVTGGGFLLLTLGESTPEIVRTLPWLAELLPVDESTVSINPSQLETYTSSQTPLEPFVGVRLPRDQGRVIVMGRTTRRIITPIVVQYNVGFGRVTVVAADLDSDAFRDWPERLDLVTAVTGGLLVDDQQRRTQVTRATAYNDLAGQLRATLDQFSVDRQFGFSVVSLILLALIAAVGPLDFLVINRVFGRPLLGWVTFPLIAIGVSVVLAMEARPIDRDSSATSWEPALSTTGQPIATESGDAADDVQQVSGVGCNRIEIFDIDSVSKVGRGFTAEYIYSHDARSYDVRFTPSASLDLISERDSLMLTAPFGYPGESYGGIQFAIEDSRLPVYQIAAEARDGAVTNEIKGMPIASRSSKGLSTECRFEPNLDGAHPLERRQGSELLEGQLVNPLPLDLLDGVLVYRNWAYILPTRMRANGRIASVASLRQKNFRWRLSRQRLQDESATETEPWDPTMIDSPIRVAEMLMFHQLVGGRRYTSLEHDPLGFLDLTHVLAEDRCMLIGRVESPLTTIQLREGSTQFTPGGQSLTFVRYVLPVINR